MNKELFIQTNPNGSEIALLEDKMLVELHQENKNQSFRVGDIFLGRVRKVMPGLNAAFVDVGHEKDAFLHYTDLNPLFKSIEQFTRQAIAAQSPADGNLSKFTVEPEIQKGGNIKDVLQPKQSVLVQVLKEPISNKGPRLSCEITLAGRYLVFTPFGDSVGVSKKIESAEERKRLKQLVESLKPEGFGVIVRTVADGKSAAVIQEDMLYLQNRWAELNRALKAANPPKLVLGEVNKTSGLLRDMLNGNFSRILTNNAATATELEELVKRIAPDKQKIVQYYNSPVPMFDHFGITRQIKAAFGKTVNLPSGAYLIIEKTEAMHVIDVNSGQRMMDGDQESTALRTNIEAATEISRQLRLRDLGGIIVIDFIDMKDAENRKVLQQKMKEEMDRDTAIHTILPLSKFNLMQITRERVKPEVKINTQEACPTCNGSGTISSAMLVFDEIGQLVAELCKTHQTLRLFVNPLVEAYLRRGFPSIRMKWFLAHKKWIQIVPDENIAITDYRFFDAHDEEIVTD